MIAASVHETDLLPDRQRISSVSESLQYQHRGGGGEAVDAEPVPAPLFQPLGQPAQSEQSHSEGAYHAEEARENDLRVEFAAEALVMIAQDPPKFTGDGRWGDDHCQGKAEFLGALASNAGQ